MPLYGVTGSVDEVDVLAAVDEADWVEEELDDTKEAIASVGIVEEVAVHLKIELTSIMSPDTLKTKSGAHSKKK